MPAATWNIFSEKDSEKIRYLHSQSDMLTDGEKGCYMQFTAAVRYGAKRTVKGTITQKSGEQNNVNILQLGLKKT